MAFPKKIVIFCARHLRWLEVFFFVFASLTWATSFYQVPFREQVSQSDKIIRAEVISSEAKTAKGVDGIERIYTYSALRVTEVLKGRILLNPPQNPQRRDHSNSQAHPQANSQTISQGSKIQVRQLGGEAGGRGLLVSGTAQFESNEDTVVFLGDQNPDGSYEVRGMAMGKFHVNVVDGEERLEGMSVDSVGGHFVRPEGQRDTTSKQWTLRELRELISTQEARPPNEKPSSEQRAPKDVEPGSTVFSSQPVAAPDLQAPPLGPQGEGKTEGVSSSLGVGAIFVILGAGVWIVLRRRRK